MASRPITRPTAAAIFVALAALAVSAPNPAAAKASAPEELFLKAVEAHKSGKLKTAVKALKKAVKSDRHPILLYNLAVLSDRAGDKKAAAKNYADYLDLTPEDSPLVLLRFQQIAPKEAKAWAKGSEEKAKPKKGGKKDDSGTAVAKKDGKKKGDGKPGEGGPIASYALLGAGAIALAIGATFGALTISDVNEFMASKVRSEAKQHADNAASHQLLANVSYLAGLAAIGGGVAMLLVREPAPGSGGDTVATTPVVAPLIGPAAAGGVLTLEF